MKKLLMGIALTAVASSAMAAGSVTHSPADTGEFIYLNGDQIVRVYYQPDRFQREKGVIRFTVTTSNKSEISVSMESKSIAKEYATKIIESDSNDVIDLSKFKPSSY